MIDVKLNECIAQNLIALGVEKPTARLTEEVERLISAKVENVVEKAVTPRIASRAFAATLTAPVGAQKGVSGMPEGHP
jgi:hypothetical protein